MKTDLTYLPKQKQEEIKVAVDKIVEMINPEMIILFGSYARNQWVEDKYVENGITYEYQSDFDLLIAVDNEYQLKPKIGKRIRHKIRRTELCDTPISLIFHNLEYFNLELEEGNYFFSDIKKEGVILYNPKNIELANAKELSPKQRQNKAKIYFDNWFQSANEFLIDFKNAFNRNSFNKAAFELHQATERYYDSILLVFIDYKPKTHDLEKLDRQVGNINAHFKTIFPRKTEEEERLFLLLKKAYIDSRYKIGYEIKKEELEYLSERVKLLQKLTKQVCEEKIESFTKNNT